jgi:plasmid stabilization system protein ParE
MIVTFHAAAAAELEEAAAWYENKRSILRREFLLEFADALNNILEHPQAWQSVKRDVRQYRLNRFPYRVVYEVQEDRILIVAVAHLRRKPQY